MSFIKIIFCLLFFCFSNNVAISEDKFLPIPIINRDDKLLSLTRSNFEVKSTAQNVVGELFSDVKWERNKENILLPFIKIRLKSKLNIKHHHFRYLGVTYLPQETESDEITDIEYSVFNPHKIVVYEDGKTVGEIGVVVLSEGLSSKTVLLDYSCSGFNVQVSGFDGEFLSIGCELIRENIKNEVTPSLKLYWLSSEYRTLDSEYGPYLIHFSEGRTAKVHVLNDVGQKKEILFKVSFPKRLHRLRVAGGLGPYSYKSKYLGNSKNSEILPSFMLYGNYYLNNIHSLKFFEALVMKEALFSHAGLYIGSELGKFYDDRMVITTLIGLQGLSYRHEAEEDIFTQMIYPQGGEISMLHPFGLENYKFIVGGFLSPQKDVIYRNFWARFGSKVFVEFNYIDWEYGERSASMYGISVGFPLAQFF